MASRGHLGIRGLLYRAGSTVGPLRTLRRRYEELEESQFWAPTTLERHQVALTRELLSHAAATVPYYRDHWSGTRVPMDLGAWPVVDKSVLKGQGLRLRSERPHPRAYAYATGGSSGTPIEFLIDPEVKRWRWAAKMRNLAWMGWRPGDRIAFIWGSDFDRKRTDDLRTQAFRRLSGQVWLNTFNATEPEYLEFGRFLRRWQPRFLVGYASSLVTFAGLCDATPELRSLRFQSIQSSAEVLHDEHKVKLREQFGAGVFDLYGQREVGNIAQNAVDGGPLLVTAESVIVELMDIDGASHVVVTDLRNKSFPLIRYDTGDLGRWSASHDPTRPALPALGGIAGRKAEMLTAPNGRLVHSEYFAHLFYGHQEVERFQLAVRANRLVIRYQAARDLDLEDLLLAVKRDIDPTWAITVERVAGFASLGSGKHCYVVHEA